MRGFRILIATFLSVFISSGSPPSLVVEPVDTVAGYDGPSGLILSATLHCQGRDDDSVISWYKDNQLIENAGISSVNVSNGWLTVGTTQSGEDVEVLEGYYYCTVMNSFGTVRSHTAWIKGQELKSFAFLGATSSLTRIENAVAVQSVYMELPPSGTLDLWSVSCELSTVTCPSSNCPFWHSFSLSGRLLSQSIIRVRYSEVQKLIPKCDVTSSVAIAPIRQHQLSGPSHNFNFNGQTLLPMKARIPSVSVKAGESAILYCISGDPNSTYSWNHNGSPVDVNVNSRYSFITDGTLEIRTAVKEDSGLYECSYTFPNIILQDVVTRKTPMNVTVYSLPTVNLTLIESDVKRNNIASCNADTPSTTDCSLMHSNSSVTLYCSAGGSTPLAIKLVNNGMQFHHENDSVSLTHANDNPSSGIYQCIVTNKYGSQQTSMFLSLPGNQPLTTDSSPTGRNPSSTPFTIAGRTASSGQATASRQGLRTKAVSFALTSFGSQDTAKAQDTVPPSCTTTTKCESEIGWKVAAAIGWVVSLVLLSVVIVLIRLIRHKDKKICAVLESQSQKNDEGLVYNPAYTSLSPKPVAGNVMNSGEYEEVDQLQ